MAGSHAETRGALLAGKHVRGEDLRRVGEQFVRLGHQRRGDLAVDVRLTGVLAAEGVEDPTINIESRDGAGASLTAVLPVPNSTS